ncbi:hypothetical protein BSLA_02f1211 [Burkholderia stabilis]|nr:hypothetical protein BSLA_02f1211 [Burkholderia stabilis]
MSVVRGIASGRAARFRFDVFQSLRRRATRFDNIGLNHSGTRENT